MAERSKAPDSRVPFLIDSERAFWSSNEGVGSNPTSDKLFSSYFNNLQLYLIIVFIGNMKLFESLKYKIVQIFNRMLSPIK